MFALLQEQSAEKAEQAPIVVRLVNHYFGEWAYNFEMKYTYPKWKWLFAKFGSTPEAAFGAYTPENAIPWYTVMFVLACILSVFVIWILKGRLSEDEPGHGQQTLEVGVLAVRGMLEDIVGPHGLQYFPIVMTFAVLILLSNLMGFFPLFITPTSATSVTFALGLSSFMYYNYIGIKENGLFGHLKHFRSELNGLLSAVHIADVGDQCDVCAWSVVIHVLQLHRHQRERTVRALETLQIGT